MSIKMSIAHATLGRPYGFPVKLAGFRMAYHSKRRRLKWIFSATRILRSSQLSGVNKNNRPPVSWELEGERQRESERWKESDRRWWHVLQKLAALRGVYVLRWRRGHFPLFFTVFFPTSAFVAANVFWKRISQSGTVYSYRWAMATCKTKAELLIRLTEELEWESGRKRAFSMGMATPARESTNTTAARQWEVNSERGRARTKSTRTVRKCRDKSRWKLHFITQLYIKYINNYNCIECVTIKFKQRRAKPLFTIRRK